MDVSYHGLAYFLASEIGASGCCWYWICDAVELLFMMLLSFTHVSTDSNTYVVQTSVRVISFF